MPPLDSDTVLRAEANAIHTGKKLPDGSTVKDIPENISGIALYRALHDRNAKALCLSGGGIRSASFALGVIEALAVHPRQPSTRQQGDKQAASADKSLLAQFDYLSTVSGGGYIGSWLSAWIARTGYPAVWSRLIGRRDHPDEEPGEISWLRAYSNYLTPRLGLFSADTWTAAALYLRNMTLNWLVIVPALCLVLLCVKAFGVGVFWLSYAEAYAPLYAVVSVVLMLVALRFALVNRPSRDAGTIVEPPTRSPMPGYGSEKKNPHHDETTRIRRGADEARFKILCLFPASLAAMFLALYLLTRGAKLGELGAVLTIVISLLFGVALYALAWIAAWPPSRWVPCGAEVRRASYWARDFGSWIAAGAVYGALIGAGLLVFALVVAKGWWFLIGNPDVTRPTAVFLLALIYGMPWIIVAQLIAEMIFVGLTSWQPHSDADREWFGRSTGWFTAVAIGWFVVTFGVFVAGVLLWYLANNYLAVKYGGSFLAAASAAFTTLVGKSSKTPASGASKTWSDKLNDFALPAAAVFFLSVLVLVISSLIDLALFGDNIIYTSLLREGFATNAFPAFLELAIGFAVTGLVAAVAWMRVNVNRFSAHSIYRNRLIRAYLGASNPGRAPNPFTGFDESDNVTMASLWPKNRSGWQPFHVVNIALNVVASSRLAWQERKAEPFTATPLHCGTATFSGTTAHALGYRPTCDYGSPNGGLTLGTALAISGAAASPNMGYHSSPLVSLLLALFNVRLGWWLGNPGTPGEDSYQSEGPQVAIKPFIYEMFGQTTDTRRYVYLSDGGHFENLGLYEMIRRRCRCIVVSDAGSDPNFGFEDLGNAVRKIAIDLGVYITFGQLRTLKARSRDNSTIESTYYAIGEIDYKTAPEGTSQSENGYILYIKPGYHGSESAGIVAYATANALFPHESTADQFFSESQFESYRTLGFEIADGILRSATENIETITRAGTLEGTPLSPERLCDLIRALDPVTIQTAEDALKPIPPTISQTVKSLDEDALRVLRGVFGRS